MFRKGKLPHIATLSAHRGRTNRVQSLHAQRISKDTRDMPLTKADKPVRRAVIDAALGLLVFLAFTYVILGASASPMTQAGRAQAAEAARITAFTGPMVDTDLAPIAVRPAVETPVRSVVLAGGSSGSALALLGGVFAVLFAFNLAFFRHLKHIYAPRRRTPWSEPSRLP
jgi:hypothetical protein